MNQNEAEKKSAKDIFSAAVEYYAPEQWEGYIVDACGDDETLRQRVRELLDAHRQQDSYFDRPRHDSAKNRVTERPGSQIGPYKLLQEIGEGGFGVVYMAEQVEPVRRKVALKIIKPGMDTKQVIARFEAERQALAMMDHPNIAKVLDAGATDSGRPYFVMELVKGVPITEFCDTNKLPAHDRLELFVTVCRAVQHAHQKGIIHRDLKPSNVMVTLHDNQPMPVIIDFGVSKAISHQLTEKTLFTAYGQMVGTPAYMSPEQAQMSRMDIDTRSDIYSLGVLLYELLTGGPPLDEERLRGTAYLELQRLIKEEEPPKPSTRLSTLGHAIANVARLRGTDPRRLGQFLSGDLDWIVMKALEKERSRRYDTAISLSNDIVRFLNDEAVEACPPSGLYRLKKYVRRNRSLVATASLVMASLLIGLVVSVTGFVQAAEERNRAVGEGKKAVAAAELAEQERDRFRQERDRAIAAEKLAEKRQQETEQKRREAEAVIDLLGEMIGSANPEQLKGPNRTVRQLLEEFSAKLDGRLIDQPAVEAKVRLMLSNVFHQYRLIDQGLLHASRAYEIRRELYGDDHELTIRALRDKGILMLVSGKDIGEGDQILEGIVRQHLPVMDQDHEFAIRTKNGALLIDQASPSERSNNFRELMEEAEAKLGAEHYITCIVRSNYAGRLIATQDYEEAERQTRLAITAKEAFSGEGDLRASLYRGMLGRIHYLRGDLEAAKEIGFAELALRRKQLGEAHGDTLSALRFALDCNYRLEEVRQATELVECYGTSLNTAPLPDAIAAVRSINRVASSNARGTTAARDHLFDLATEVYLKAVRQEGAENLESGISEGQTLLRAVLQRNPESAEQIARSMWDVYGEYDPSLAGDLVRAILAKDDLDGALHFVQQELSPQSAGFEEFDTNSDGSITSLEMPGFWNTQQSLFSSNGGNRVSNLDTNDDDKLTPDEVGETLWKVIVDADHNQNGTIEAFEPAMAIDAAQFAKLDIDGDGKLTAEELTLLSVRLQRLRDHDGDGVVTREEYLKGFVRSGGLGRGLFGGFSKSLTAEEKFAIHDDDSDGRVSIDEVAPEYWKSIANFDRNQDGTVEIEEHREGVRELTREKSVRFFRAMDADANGLVSEQEAPSTLWPKWTPFDSDNDSKLNQEEFIRSQLDSTTLQ